MVKKIFYFSSALLILVLIFLGAYNFAFKNNVNNPVADPSKKTNTLSGGSGPIAGTNGKIESLINEAVLGAVPGEKDRVFYFSLDDHALKMATAEGKDKTVLLSNLPGEPTRALWSAKRDKVLLYIRQSTGQMLWYEANLPVKSLTPLKPEISRVVWNNLGDKIFYEYADPKTGAHSLNIADPDGSNWKKLSDIGNRDVYLSAVPQSTTLSFWNKPNALEKTTFETIDIFGQNHRTLLSDKFGADYLWAPSGERVLVSVTGQKGGSQLILNVMNKNGGEFQSLQVPTLISKAVWGKDGKTLFYALPGDLPSTAVLPNDYFDQHLNTKDTFWKMDVETGKKTRLVDLTDVSQNFDSTDFFLSDDENAVFFTDRLTKRLYRIEL